MTSHPFLEFQEEKGEQSDFPGPQVSRLAARIRAGPPSHLRTSRGIQDLSMDFFLELVLDRPQYYDYFAFVSDGSYDDPVRFSERVFD